ncbi:MAG: class I SAM-dependent methyltransferase [Patescibacteria group bacterium]|jgi:predicted O-methyltransferase YrrM
MLKEGLRIGLISPLSVGMYITYGKNIALDYQLYALLEWLKVDTHVINPLLDIIRNCNPWFHSELKSNLGDNNYGQIAFPDLLYVLVRLFEPTTVVETGVSAGVSSSYILQAIVDNRKGTLYSIDYPNYALTEAKNVVETGFAVPKYLRSNWKLMEGKSVDVLPTLIRSLDNIDIFIHDSEHSYDNMKFEYEEVWCKIPRKGLLISHDINDNGAFREFANNVGCRYKEVFFTGLGVIKK